MKPARMPLALAGAAKPLLAPLLHPFTIHAVAWGILICPFDMLQPQGRLAVHRCTLPRTRPISC